MKSLELRLAVLVVLTIASMAQGQNTSSAENTTDSYFTDASVFASIAEREVSQLHDGITLAEWMKTRATTEKWDTSTDESFFDCRTLVKTEILPSGIKIAIATYFYPPRAPSPAILPSLSGDELIARTCTLAMVRLEAQAPRSQMAHVLTEAVTRLFVDRYGQVTVLSAGEKALRGGLPEISSL